MSNVSEFDSEKATNDDPESKYRRWNEEITKAKKEFKDFHTSGAKVNRVYKDERKDDTSGVATKFNIFTSNVDILKAMLYSETPKVTIKRRFDDSADDVARVASEILRRCVMQGLDNEQNNFDTLMGQCVQDKLIPGLGQAWLRIETETAKHELQEQGDSDGELMQEPTTYEEIADQYVCIEYVFWEDFLCSPARVWDEVRWVARRVYMTRDALVARFGAEKGKQVTLDYRPNASDRENSNASANEVFDRATVYEIWDKTTRKVLWLSPSYKELLDEKDDFLNLEDFFPCPPPLVAFQTTTSVVPRAEYALHQDQYQELNEVNGRISLLVAACRVVGVYDSANDGIKNMLQEGRENTLIPVDSWAVFAERGGMKGAVDWLPLDVVIAALERLRESREDIKAQIYELTGMNDIVRGTTKASETLGAQQLKSQYTNVRVSDEQKKVEKFAQGLLARKAELICKHVDPKIIAKMANVSYTPDALQPGLIEQAIQLLKGNEYLRCWRIKIAEGSLALQDTENTKKDRVELINAVATYLQSAATTLKAIPGAAPMLFEVMKFAISGFRGAQEMEGVIDRGIQVIMQDIQQQKQMAQQQAQKPDPQLLKVQAESQAREKEIAMEGQSRQQELQMESAAKQQELMLEARAAEQEDARNRERFMMEMQQDQMRFEQDLHQDAVSGQQKLELARQQAAQKPKPKGGE